MTGSPSGHAVAEGRVWHVREHPFRHGFDYRVHMLLLDLDHLETAFEGSRLWRLDGAAPGSFRQADHLSREPGEGSLAERARDAAERRLGFRPEGRVRLLSQPRYLGYTFNPVTFYLFESPDGEPSRLDAILLEVSNTPWNERHVYALDARGREGPWEFEQDKDFHVSPFLPMEMTYRFRFEFDGRVFKVLKQNWQDGERRFVARMEVELAALTAPALNRALRALPPTTVKVICTIYWQALKLWLRGAKYHSPPDPGAEASAHHRNASSLTTSSAQGK